MTVYPSQEAVKLITRASKMLQNGTNRCQNGSRLRYINSPSNDTPYLARTIRLLVATNAAGREHFIAFRPKRWKSYKVYAPCFRLEIRICLSSVLPVISSLGQDAPDLGISDVGLRSGWVGGLVRGWAGG